MCVSKTNTKAETNVGASLVCSLKCFTQNVSSYFPGNCITKVVLSLYLSLYFLYYFTITNSTAKVMVVLGVRSGTVSLCFYSLWAVNEGMPDFKHHTMQSQNKYLQKITDRLHSSNQVDGGLSIIRRVRHLSLPSSS